MDRRMEYALRKVSSLEPLVARAVAKAVEAAVRRQCDEAVIGVEQEPFMVRAVTNEAEAAVRREFTAAIVRCVEFLYQRGDPVWVRATNPRTDMRGRVAYTSGRFISVRDDNGQVVTFDVTACCIVKTDLPL